MKTHKVPLRMCVCCKSMLPKKEMLRIIKTNEGVISLDFSGKANGRGAYICDSADCINKLKKVKALDRAFSMKVDPTVYEAIINEYAARKA